MPIPDPDAQPLDRGSEPRPRRWVCACGDPPVLLATLDGNQINLKIRDRYYHIEGLHGRIRATCPRCGRQHTIECGMPGRPPQRVAE